MTKSIIAKGKVKKKFVVTTAPGGVGYKAKPSTWQVSRGDTRVPLDGGDAEVDVVVCPPGSKPRTVTMKPAEFVKPKKAADAILNATGCTMEIGDLEAKIKLLPSLPPLKVRFTTHRSGRVNGLFVLPRRSLTLVEGSPRNVVFDRGRADRNEALGGLGAHKGSIKGWKTRVAPLVGHSTIGMTVVAAALAAPLLELSDLSEAFLIILAGPSSGGKSILTLVAMSVQGEATRAQMVPPGLSERALEEVGQGYNSLLLPFDDLGRITDVSTVRKTVRWLTYQFSDGGGRLVGDAAMRLGLSFERVKAVGLISSERSSAENAKLAGEIRQPGESARMFDLCIDPDKGVFDQISEGATQTPEAIAKKLEAVVKEEYGSPLPALLIWLRGQELDEVQFQLRASIRKFVDHTASGGDNVQRRAADKFGLMYAALLFGREAGIIPWSDRKCLNSLAKTYRSAMSDPDRVAPAAALVERLRNTLRLSGRTLEAGTRGKVMESTGDHWLAISGLSFKGVPTLGIREAELRASFPNAVEYDRLIAELVAAGWLTVETGKKRWQPRVQIGGMEAKPRLLRVSTQLLVG